LTGAILHAMQIPRTS